MMLAWVRYIGETRHPLRRGQIVLRLGVIANDPKGRYACVVLAGAHTLTVAIQGSALDVIGIEEVEALSDEDFKGGLS
jgi:hypothetical protein